MAANTLQVGIHVMGTNKRWSARVEDVGSSKAEDSRRRRRRTMRVMLLLV